MHTKNQISLTGKTIYGIMLLAILLSAFGAGNLPSARAQEVITDTSTLEVTQTPTDVPSLEPTQTLDEIPTTIEGFPRAQEVVTDSPTPDTTETPTLTPTQTSDVGIQGANCSSPVVLDDQWASGFRLVCQNNLYVLMLDLTNPAIKVEVVAASSGNHTLDYYKDGNTIAIINADYQWPCPSGAICSQGMTISNDSTPTQLTNIQHLCTDAWVRREIGFSQDGRPTIDWWYKFVSDSQARSWCSPWHAEGIPNGDSGGGKEQYSFNLVGAGPQFTFDGTFRWQCGDGTQNHDCPGNMVINGEQFGSGTWWNRYQSAIGYSNDGTTLVLAESNNQTHTIQDVHDIMFQRLSTYGKTLKNAFKFDGGSKAGFWYYNHTYDSTPGVTVPNVIRIQRTNSTCYSLSTNINPGGSGNVSVNTSSNCAQGKYTPDTSVQLNASPNGGYSFNNWSGDASGTGSNTTIVMNSNKNVTANFSSTTVTLNVTKSGIGSGTVTSNPAGIDCGSDCSESYANNTSVTLSATPTAPSTFGGWNGGGCSGTGTCTITMNSAQSVTATFNSPSNQTLMISKAGIGSGIVTSSPAGINCGSTCSYAFNFNTLVTLTASASTDSTFTGWSGACTGTGSCVVTMTTIRSVTASFTIQSNIPLTPQNFHVSNSTPTSITLAWDDVGNETGFKIYEWNGSTFVYLATVGANQTTYTETRANCGWDEFYTVSAYNGNGESQQSGWLQGYTLACPAGPTTPAIISPIDRTVVVYPQNIVFDWSDSGDTYTFYFPGGPSSTEYGTTASTTTVNAPLAGFYEWFVIAHKNGQDSGPSAYTDLYIVPSAPGTVTVTTNSQSAVTVNWTTSLGGVDGYYIYRDGIYVDEVGPNTYSYPVTSLPCGNTSTYSVTGWKGLGTYNESPERSASGSTSSCLPAATLLRAPIGDIGTNYNPVYTWDKVAIATYYRLYVSGPSGVVLDQWYQAVNICNTTTCSVVSPTLGGGAHIWYVQTWNPAGYGPWSAATNFSTTIPTVPVAATLTSPTGNIGTNYNPTYTWNKVDTATYYLLNVSGPGGVVLNQWYLASNICNTTTCSVASPTLLGGAHSWYVQTWNSAGYGPKSAAMTFSTQTIIPPPVAALTAPTGNIGTNYNPTYTWNKISSAIYYLLYVSGPSGVVLNQWYLASSVCNATTCSVVSPTLGGGAHAWYVQTWNSAGYGPWSAAMNFSTEPVQLPGPATLTAPSGTIASHTPTYQWNKVNTATWYRLYVSKPGGVALDQWYQAASICNATTCSILSPTLGSGAHVWYVQTYNTAGYGPWTSASFTVSP